MQPGDKVKVIGNRTSSNFVGMEMVLVDRPKSNSSGYEYWNVLDIDGDKHQIYETDLQLINKKNKEMTIKEKFTLAFKAEPEKTFRKAGIINGDDFLTEEGQLIFLSWLLKKYGEEFKKEVVDDLVKDKEEETKK